MRLGGRKLQEYHCRTCEEKKAYEKRICGKHPRPHNPLVKISAAWIPRVKPKEGANRIIPGFTELECPTSYITAETSWLLELISANEVAHGATGATMWGPDTRKYPAWWLDALAAIAGVKAAYERTEHEANLPKK